METTLPQDIAEFAAVATKRLTRFGGVPTALLAETDDQLRDDARVALSDLGAFDLDVRGSADDLLAAAVLCQAAGAACVTCCPSARWHRRWPTCRPRWRCATRG